MRAIRRMQHAPLARVRGVESKVVFVPACGDGAPSKRARCYAAPPAVWSSARARAHTNSTESFSVPRLSQSRWDSPTLTRTRTLTLTLTHAGALREGWRGGACTSLRVSANWSTMMRCCPGGTKPSSARIAAMAAVNAAASPFMHPNFPSQFSISPISATFSFVPFVKSPHESPVILTIDFNRLEIRRRDLVASTESEFAQALSPSCRAPAWWT